MLEQQKISQFRTYPEFLRLEKGIPPPCPICGGRRSWMLPLRIKKIEGTKSPAIVSCSKCHSVTPIGKNGKIESP